MSTSTDRLRAEALQDQSAMARRQCIVDLINRDDPQRFIGRVKTLQISRDEAQLVAIILGSVIGDFFMEIGPESGGEK